MGRAELADRCAWIDVIEDVLRFHGEEQEIWALGPSRRRGGLCVSRERCRFGQQSEVETFAELRLWGEQAGRAAVVDRDDLLPGNRNGVEGAVGGVHHGGTGEMGSEAGAVVVDAVAVVFTARGDVEAGRGVAARNAETLKPLHISR